jgi:hypothetical protein
MLSTIVNFRLKLLLRGSWDAAIFAVGGGEVLSLAVLVQFPMILVFIQHIFTCH